MGPTPWTGNPASSLLRVYRQGKLPVSEQLAQRKRLSDYLKKNGVVGLEGIDTRKLVRHIRTQGAMRGIISSTETKLTA